MFFIGVSMNWLIWVVLIGSSLKKHMRKKRMWC